MAHMYVENDDDNIRFDDMDCIYDENRMPLMDEKPAKEPFIRTFRQQAH